MSKAAQYRTIANQAHAAGIAAAERHTPDAMYVHDARLGRTYHVAGGVCGFAWVELKGNTGFGRWAKKAGVARPGYPTGLTIRANVGGQSMSTKEAYAHAYADTLRSHGITAYAVSRMD